MKDCRVILIDSEHRLVTENTLPNTVKAFKSFIKGKLDFGTNIDGEDLMYIEEASSLKYGFLWRKKKFLGNAIIIGRGGTYTSDAKSDLEHIKAQVKFFGDVL